MNLSKTAVGMEIYATGVFVTLEKIGDRLVWVADRFEDSSFRDGDYIDPIAVLDSERKREELKKKASK